MLFATSSLFLATLFAAEPTTPPAPPSRVVTLTQALSEAHAHQPTLTAARASRMASDAQADAVQGGLLPQVNGRASYLLGRGTGSFRSGDSSMPTTSASLFAVRGWSFGLSASQLLWDFGQTPGRFRAAQASAASLAATERTTEDDVALGVRNTFFSARAARALVHVAEETLANQERHLKQIQGFVELGSRPAIDLSQARADRGNARVQLITAQNDYDVARATLLQAMGTESDTDFDLGEETLAALPEEGASLTQLLDEAIRARPELASLQWVITSQEQTLRATRGAYLPALSATGSFGESGQTLDELNWNWTGGLNLSWSIFQGGATRATVRQNSAQILRAQAQLATARQQIRLEVQQAQLGVRAAKATLEAAEETAVSAADRLRLAEGRYATGIGNIIELGDAQVAHTAAAAQTIQAEFRLFSARAQLLHALGRA